MNRFRTIFLTAKNRRGRKKSTPRSFGSLCSFAVSTSLWVLLCSPHAEAADSWEKAYRAGDYTNAFQALEKTTQLFPDVGNYNRGNVLYRMKDFQGSEKAYAEAVAKTDDETLKQKALYNRGTVLLAGAAAGKITNRLDSVENAIDLFEQSLELKPEDTASKKNIERALNWVRDGRCEQATKLIFEADQMLEKNEAKRAKKNYESAQKILAPVLEDFAPKSKKAFLLKKDIEQKLAILKEAVLTTRNDLEKAKLRIDDYEFEKAKEIVSESSQDHRRALDIDEKLNRDFTQFMESNGNVLELFGLSPVTNP